MTGELLKAGCPHCGQHIEYGDDIVGAQISCPECGEEVTLADLRTPPPLAPVESPNRESEDAEGAMGRTFRDDEEFVFGIRIVNKALGQYIGFDLDAEVSGETRKAVEFLFQHSDGFDQICCCSPSLASSRP